MEDYKHFKITIWEHGKTEPIVTEYHGYVHTDMDLVRHYGLHNADVDKYKIERI